MKNIAVLLLSGILLFGTLCNKEDDTDIVCDECKGLFSKEETMWIFSEKGSCESNTNEECFLVQFGSNYTDSEDAWEVFEQDICGFEYEVGFIYKLEIQKAKDKDNDEFEYKYCLVRVVSKTQVSL